MQKNEIIQVLDKQTIESMIYIIRGQKVMLDFELAKIYGYKTRDFNNQVKHNIEKFEDDFRFQLTIEEWKDYLRWKNSTANSKKRYLPYAFTEQGIYMLMTVLKGELATKQSKMLIRAFKEMKDYIVENNNLTSINELLKLTSQVNSNTEDIKDIKGKLEIVMDNFIDPSTYKHFLIKDGQKIEADVAYQEIYKLAKYSIYVIDDYIDVKTLQLLKVCKVNVDIIIIGDNKAKNNINDNFIKDFIHDTGLSIKFIQNKNIFHDRYIVVDYNTFDYKLFHCGHSSKDAGKNVSTIMEIEEKELYKISIDVVLKHSILTVK